MRYLFRDMSSCIFNYFVLSTLVIYIYMYMCVCVCVETKIKEMGWAQKLPLFYWLRNGRYKKGYGSIRNWEMFIELHWGVFKGELGCFSSLLTKRQRARVTVRIKVVFWEFAELYAPKTRWSVRFSFLAKICGSAQLRTYSRLFFLDSTSCNLVGCNGC